MRRTIRPLGSCLLGLAMAGAASALPGQVPGLLFSTYHGGSSYDVGRKVAAGPGGSLWVAGYTASPDLPAATNALEDPGSNQDAFVSRWAPDGALLFSTYVGTELSDEACGLAVRADGTAFVAILSTDGFYATAVYIARVGPAGELESVRFVATPPEPSCTDLALDPRGRLWVSGAWTDADGYRAGYLARVDPGGPGTSSFLFPRTLFLDIRSLAFGPSGDLWITGSAPARGPVLYSHPMDAFVARLSPDATVIRWSAVFGGSTGDEQGQALAVDARGNAWVTGWTWAEDFPALHAVQPAYGGGTDAFAAVVGPTGELIVSTYLGGAGWDHGEGIAVGPRGATVVGATDGEGFPGAGPTPVCDPGPYCGNAFVSWLSPGGSELLRSVLLGSGPDDQAADVALDTQGIAAVTGWTHSSDFPTVDAPQPLPHGYGDAFLARLAPPNRPPACAAASASPAVLWPPNGRLIPVTIRGMTDPDGDPVALQVTAIRQDEPLSREEQPDATGIGTARPMVRAGRAGGGDGRVYRIAFTATDPQGAACAGTVAVCVPHDRGKPTCGDGGALFDSMC